MSIAPQRLPILLPALLATALLSACAGSNDFEATCRAAGHEPDTAAWTRCLDDAYAFNARLANRYRSGGP